MNNVACSVKHMHDMKRAPTNAEAYVSIDSLYITKAFIFIIQI